MKESSVLVLDGQWRQALAIIRSLGIKGIRVTAGEETFFSTGFFSRYCKQRIVYPSPKKNKEAFINFLKDHLKKNSYETVFAVDATTVSLLAEYQNEFSKYTKVPLVDFQTFLRADDKALVLELAEKEGIPSPKSFLIDEENKLKDVSEKLTFPLVIKPRRGSGARGVNYVYSEKELREKYDRIGKVYGQLLAQEYIPPGGESYGVSLLLNQQTELRAVFVHRRLREYPLSGGPSTLRESVSFPELTTRAIKLLQALKWFGVAMVEFKIDPRDGKAKLMEINPRFWGSLQLAILSGVDFPYLLYRIITQGDTEPVVNYKVGVKCRWLLPGDILHFVVNPKRWELKPSFFDFGIPDDIISFSDPGPSFGFFFATLRYMFDQKMWKFVLRR